MINPLNLYKYLPYLLRKRFNKKYIIIESDDWGMSQITSDRGIEFLKKKYGKDKFTRWTTDALETCEDLHLLFDVLNKYKSSFIKPPVITANFITHNIDYNVGSSLSFVPLSNFLNNSLRELYNKGIKEGILCPQLHGYCHFNVLELNKYFMSKEGKELFNHGILTGKNTIKGYSNMFQSEFSQYHSTIMNNFDLSLNEFQNFFHYKPISLIPPHFILDKKLLPMLIEHGILAIQASSRLVNSNNKRYRKIFFKSNQGILWIPRNARLDPHPDYNYYSDQCISAISKAFADRIPAIIDFHRVNFAGNYNRKYRDRSLDELQILLSKVKNNWPEVKFITTADLIKLCQTKIK